MIEWKPNDIFTRREVFAIVKPNPYFTNFDDAVFEYQNIRFNDFITTIRTCRAPKETFLVTAQKILYNKSSEDKKYIEDVMKLVESYRNTGPLYISSFRHRALMVRWSQHYPSDSGIPENDIIVEDGNHRLTALAIRNLQGMKSIYESIGLFIGRLPK